MVNARTTLTTLTIPTLLYADISTKVINDT